MFAFAPIGTLPLSSLAGSPPVLGGGWVSTADTPETWTDQTTTPETWTPVPVTSEVWS